jgi:hypothetical protein
VANLACDPTPRYRDHSVLCACPCACPVDATPKRPAVFQVRAIIVGRLLGDLHVEPEVSCLFPRYHCEQCEGMQFLRKFRSIGSYSTQCILHKSASSSSRLLFGDHGPLHQHSDAKPVAGMDAHYGRISAKILLGIKYSLLGKLLSLWAFYNVIQFSRLFCEI